METNMAIITKVTIIKKVFLLIMINSHHLRNKQIINKSKKEDVFYKKLN